MLTRRKGPAPDQPAGAFTQIMHPDTDGRQWVWDLADTEVDLPLAEAKDAPDVPDASGHPPREEEAAPPVRSTS